MRKLSKKKIRWILRWKRRGLTNKEIAETQNITPRCVRYLYSEYRKHGKLLSGDREDQENPYHWITSSSYSRITEKLRGCYP